ncbi:MAG: DNA polymerase I [Peptococcia bacterium]
MAEKFVIIDGNSLVNRAYYALPMLSNSNGLITNAIYGFTKMLFKVIEDEQPDCLAVAFDKSRIVFRHQEYADYKAQRKPMPTELRTQLPILKELLQTMQISIFEIEGYEADDIIGTMVRKAEKAGMESIIVTGDRDALQLVTNHTKVWLTKKGLSEVECYDPQFLEEKYGLTPEQVIDLKGLMGDASDNIPGIPGVGEKTALKLLKEYGSVEEVLAHHEDFKGKKLGQSLVQYADQARLSKRLATIDCAVPLEAEIEQCRRTDPDYPQLLEMLQELEFKNIIQQVMEKMQASEDPQGLITAEDYPGSVVTNPEILEKYLQKTTDWLGFLYQHKKIDLNRLEITSLAVIGRGQEAVVLQWQEKEELEDFLAMLEPYLENPAVIKATHDCKTAYLAFGQYGIKLQGVKTDTQLMSYLLNPSYNFNNICDVSGKFLNRQICNELKVEDLYKQLAALEELDRFLPQELDKYKMLKLYQELELPLAFVLAEMEKTGIILDKEILSTIGDELNSRIDNLMTDIYDLAGEEFNINSPKQLGVILFEKLGLPKGKKTKTGYSTSAGVLEALAPDHEIVAKILEYRQLVKLNSTYIEGLQAIMVPETGKVHTSFNQTVTATGRLSSSEPNLQNIPIRLEEGRRIRKAFLPSPGNLLLAADYSQIELRVLAHFAEDPVLIEAFHKGQDIHTRTAAEVFGVPFEDVSKEMRYAAKAVNFGIVYGISDFGLAQDLKISRGEAKAYIDSYFARYQGVKNYIDRTVNQAREQGYVTTILQRRRYLPDILSSNYHLRSFAERTAMNTPIQGSAADIIKLAMLKVQQFIDREMPTCRMLLQVHDELIFDVPAELLETMAEKVRELMCDVYPLAVPLKVDLQAGPNWYELRKL